MPIDSQVFKLLTDRLDKQDDLLEKILEQAKTTNGRVIDHEHRIGQLETNEQQRGNARFVRSERRHTRVGWIVAGICVLLSGGFGEQLLHALGVV